MAETEDRWRLPHCRHRLGKVGPRDDVQRSTRSAVRRRPSGATSSPDGLIAITVNELSRLLHALIIDPARRAADVIAWSLFRRRHQAAAKTSHYTRQAPTEP
jgi:hypothetical protein